MVKKLSDYKDDVLKTLCKEYKKRLEIEDQEENAVFLEDFINEHFSYIPEHRLKDVCTWLNDLGLIEFRCSDTIVEYITLNYQGILAFEQTTFEKCLQNTIAIVDKLKDLIPLMK